MDREESWHIGLMYVHTRHRVGDEVDSHQYCLKLETMGEHLISTGV